MKVETAVLAAALTFDALLLWLCPAALAVMLAVGVALALLAAHWLRGDHLIR